MTNIVCLLALALAVGLRQDFGSWTVDVSLLFAAALIGLVLTFPSHFLTTSEDFVKSKRKSMYFFLAGILHPPLPSPFARASPVRAELSLVLFYSLFVRVDADGVAFIQFAGFGLCLAAFVYGLAKNVNGSCEAAGATYCQVFRLTLAFDLLLGYAPILSCLLCGD